MTESTQPCLTRANFSRTAHCNMHMVCDTMPASLLRCGNFASSVICSCMLLYQQRPRGSHVPLELWRWCTLVIMARECFTPGIAAQKRHEEVRFQVALANAYWSTHANASASIYRPILDQVNQHHCTRNAFTRSPTHLCLIMRISFNQTTSMAGCGRPSLRPVESCLTFMRP